MKGQKKGILFGFVLALVLMCGVNMITGSGASASTAKKTVSIDYKDIKICIDGQMVTPKDANGKVVEPFILDGTTYLPVRAVGSAFGKEVDYDGASHTVYIGAKPAGGGATGTRSNPLSGSTGATVTYKSLSSYPDRQFSVKVLKTITGEAANYMAAQAASESMNRLPAAGEEYVFFEVECKYISSSKGEDDGFDPGSAVSGTKFFGADGSALPVSDHTYIMSYGKFASYEPKTIYPGGSAKFLVGALVNKGYDKVLLKVPNHISYNNETNTWILMNDSASNVISTVDGVKAAYNIDQGSNTDHSNDPIKVTLRNTLPTTLSSYTTTGNNSTLQASARITDFSYTVSGTSVKISFTGEKTYDAQGAGQSRQVKVGWKLYDSDGYVVDDGVAYSTSIKTGEKFKNCEDTIRGLEPGEYTLEIMGVN